MVYNLCFVLILFRFLFLFGKKEERIREDCFHFDQLEFKLKKRKNEKKKKKMAFNDIDQLIC